MYVSFNQVTKTVGTAREKVPPGATKAEEVVRLNTRHRLWSKRCLRAPGVGDSADKVKKKPRYEASNWVLHVHNMLKASTMWEDGIKDFIYDGSKHEWSNANYMSWPTLTLASDQGSDGMSGAHGLLYLLRASLTIIWDPWHGAAWDFEAAAKACGLWPLVLAFLIVVNLPQGPDKDEGLRWEQLNQSTTKYFKKFRAATGSLFQKHAPAMLEQFGQRVPPPESDQTNTDALWSYLEDLLAADTKGSAIDLCRFLAFPRGLGELMATWSWRQMRCEILALDAGMLDSKTFRENALVTSAMLADAEQVGDQRPA